ncbi:MULTISPECIES: tetratricopeptide repeat protein [Arthrobacter]|uniref:Tetratricopeptide repeat protein n=2 Tax=Arthrobacter TaxID=1663 RepID=A0ABU9KNE0_9MICC|nr:tetratricopeptide repeat protein [Arthrobacter sp. YJM1]MDP5228376.1 tetratricopeptide repeat protein [Arthrobacter sp. YJM1]
MPQAAQNPFDSLASLRGAVDLSGLRARAQAPQAPAGVPAGESGEQAAPGAYRADVTEANFQEVVELSVQVPVILALWAGYSPESQRVLGLVEEQVNRQDGAMVLGAVDVEGFPQIMQAMQISGVPAAVAVLKGQPVPLFQGPVEEDHLTALFAELLQLAQANGVTGRLGSAPGGTAETEQPLPPLHQEALDAIDAGDYAGAERAYRKALDEQPADADAKAGLAQVGLLQRLDGLNADDAQSLREQAAALPDDVDVQLSLADLDVSGGHVEDAFARIVAFIGGHFGPERETARVRLLELFEVVGIKDPRVAAARQALARVLF